MKFVKLITFIAVVSFVFTSCSMGGGHTRCAAYSINEPTNEILDSENQIDSKDFKEADLVY